MLYQPLFHGYNTITFLINPMTCQKVTLPKDTLSPSLWGADSNIYVNVLRKRLAVSASNPYQCLVSGWSVWGVSNCSFCQRASRDDQTVLDYIHIGVGALWAPIVLKTSPCVISRALEWYRWTGLAWIKWPGIDEQSGFSAWFQGQREVENCSTAPIRYANGHISPHWDLMHNLTRKMIIQNV